LIEFDRVSRRHGAFRLALADVSFSIARGEFVVVRGANGSGKTTLLRLAAALDAPSSGTVRVAGQDLGRLKPSAIPVLRQSMGIVPQDLLLLDDRSVLDNVALSALAAGLSRTESQLRARAAIERCGLDPGDAGRLRPALLGGGDRQRVALARALVNRPVLLLIDEPTSQLDQTQARAVWALIDQFATAGITVLAASRDERDQWPLRARQLRLQNGRLAAPSAMETA
jgi:cell division transport system ATP-binding protein